MACGCAERKKLNDSRLLDNNIPLTNNKILQLDSIQNLSIDEIISLYKDGFRLDQLGDDIKNLSYGTECSGTPTTDIYRPLSQTGGFMIYRGIAFAQKIVPTSRCLDFIYFYDVKRYNTYNIHFEIRQDSGGLPSGAPGSSTGRIVDILVPYGNIDTTPGPLIVDFLTILPSTGTPYWIVVYSSDYICNSSYTTSGYERIELSRSYTSATERAAYITSSCSWQSLAGDAFAMETFKLNYSPPPPSLNAITISPSTATKNIGLTQQLTATCKDQYNNTMTCPTLSWVSDNPSVATVNSSGLVTAVATGTPANITASASGKISNASVITVTSPSQVLTTIIVSPSTASINIGGIQQLNAVCKDQFNSTMICPSLSWQSSNPSVATVNSSGLVTAVSSGNTNVTASASGHTSNNSAITVLPSGGATCQSITTPIAGPSTIYQGEYSLISATVTPSVTTSQEFFVQFMDGTDPIGSQVMTSNHIAAKYYYPSVGTHNVSAKVGSECTSPDSVQIVVNPGSNPSAGGGGIVLVLAAVAGAAILLSKKP